MLHHHKRGRRWTNAWDSWRGYRCSPRVHLGWGIRDGSIQTVGSDSSHYEPGQWRWRLLLSFLDRVVVVLWQRLVHCHCSSLCFLSSMIEGFFEILNFIIFPSFNGCSLKINININECTNTSQKKIDERQKRNWGRLSCKYCERNSSGDNPLDGIFSRF